MRTTKPTDGPGPPTEQRQGCTPPQPDLSFCSTAQSTAQQIPSQQKSCVMLLALCELHTVVTQTRANATQFNALSDSATTETCSSPVLSSPPPCDAHLLELVLTGAADLGGEALGQLLQAAGVLQLDLGLPAEELLQVLQQLQARLRLLLQAFELLHQLCADLWGHTREKKQGKLQLHTEGHPSTWSKSPSIQSATKQTE